MSKEKAYKIPQDLHIHTVFSTDDSMVVPEQTLQLIADVGHADRIGISDHFESLHGKPFTSYEKEVRSYKFFLGTEVDGHTWVQKASTYPFDYYFYHCFDTPEDYDGLKRLMDTGRPVVVSHPAFVGTKFENLPEGCLVEINNRYIWRSDWRNFFTPYISKFRFVISSDAHQPWMLNQVIARYVANELNIKEEILFD